MGTWKSRCAPNERKKERQKTFMLSYTDAPVFKSKTPDRSYHCGGNFTKVPIFSEHKNSVVKDIIVTAYFFLSFLSGHGYWRVSSTVVDRPLGELEDLSSPLLREAKELSSRTQIRTSQGVKSIASRDRNAYGYHLRLWLPLCNLLLIGRIRLVCGHLLYSTYSIRGNTSSISGAFPRFCSSSFDAWRRVGCFRLHYSLLRYEDSTNR